MDFSIIFERFLRKNTEFDKALSILQNNSIGKKWLIGGYLYRGIASELYGVESPKVDLDFIVEQRSTEIKLPSGWSVNFNRYGTPKLTGNDISIDLVQLSEVYAFRCYKLASSIENFLSCSPLTIQSLTYDVINKKVNGEIGMDSLLKREVAINHPEMARYAAMKKGITLNEMIRKKSESLRFKPIY